MLEIWHPSKPVQVHALEIVAGDAYETWVQLADHAVIIGRVFLGGVPQIELAVSSLSKRHCEIRPAGDGFVVVDLHSSGGTFINSMRLLTSMPPYTLADNDTIYLGSAWARFHAGEMALAIESVEQHLIDAVHAGAPGAREIYGDWLEVRGDFARAEYVRTWRDGLGHDELRRRAALGARIDPRWRLRVVTSTQR